MKLSSHIQVKVGDITQECCDVIVNAANSSLFGGGGVDGAIHRAGGSEILDACRDIRASTYPDGLPTGKAVATTAGKMCSKYVVHTVGPIYFQCGEECEALLVSCYQNAMNEVIRLGCKSVAFPAISTGIYGYPKVEAATIAFNTALNFTQDKEMEVLFVFHSQEDYDLFVSTVNS